MAEVIVYCGQHTEATFLKRLLEGNGISARLASLAATGHDDIGVYIAPSDLARAQAIVEDFEANGRKTSKFWD